MISTATLLLLAFLTCIIAIDQNVGDFLYLKLVKVPLLFVRLRSYQLKLYIQLRFDMLLMRKGIIPKRFFDMAEQIDKTP
jgi:hypothetical protein